MQRGFSLVELMIALTIGLILLLGLGSTYYSMRQTYLLTRSVSTLQLNQNMATSILGSALRNAGFYPVFNYTNVPNTPNTQDSVFPATATFPAVGQALAGTAATANGTPSDTLSIRFQTDCVPPAPGYAPGQQPQCPVNSTTSGLYQGCSAALLPNKQYVDTYSIVGGYLQCTETNITDGIVATPVNLISGIATMSISYGVDTTGGGAVTQYIATGGMSAANWSAIKTVTFLLTFTNPLAGQAGQPATVSTVQTIPFQSAL